MGLEINFHNWLKKVFRHRLEATLSKAETLAILPTTEVSEMSRSVIEEVKAHKNTGKLLRDCNQTLH